MLKDFEDLEIQNLINEKAPGGIKIGKKTKIKVDNSYARTIPQLHGLESGIKELEDDSPESLTKKVYFNHRDKAGKVHELYVNVGVDIERNIEKQFQKLCEKHSELFYDDPDFFPFLLDKKGQPYLHRLNLREDAVIKSNPATIKLPPDHQNALTKAINQKLRNNTFVRLPRDEQSYCNPVSVVPKSSFDEHGNRKWRLIQSMVNISENSLFINFRLESPRELLEKLPPGAKYYNFFDSVSSFDSLLLHPDDVMYTGFVAPDPKTDGKTYETFGCSRQPQGHLNGTPNLVKTYNTIFEECIRDHGLAIYCDDFLNGHSTQKGLLQATRKIFEASSKARVRYSPLKSAWFVKAGIFCGLYLKNGALTVPKKYAEKVEDCQRPTTKAQLQRFLGLVCYTKAFIQDYGKHTANLLKLINQVDEKGKLPWSEENEEAFQRLKFNIKQPLALYSLDYDAKDSSLHLFFDSSKNSRAGVLFQRVKNPTDSLPEYRLIDYYSQPIPATQKWAGILRNEWMALVAASDIWHRYLLINNMEKYIYTDSKALWLLTQHRGRKTEFQLYHMQLHVDGAVVLFEHTFKRKTGPG